MSQNDFNLANQGFPSMRADMNSAFQALATNSAGTSAPSLTYAYQWWYDETNDILKMRNADNDAWVSIASYNQTTDQWFPFVGATALTATGADLNTLTGFDAATPGSAPIYACRAWVNFVGQTGVIRGSGNVSSVTRTAAGRYIVNFTTAMANINFSTQVSTMRTSSQSATVAMINDSYTENVNNVGILLVSLTGGAATETDGSVVNVAVFQ